MCVYIYIYMCVCVCVCGGVCVSVEVCIYVCMCLYTQKGGNDGGEGVICVIESAASLSDRRQI